MNTNIAKIVKVEFFSPATDTTLSIPFVSDDYEAVNREFRRMHDDFKENKQKFFSLLNKTFTESVFLMLLSSENIPDEISNMLNGFVDGHVFNKVLEKGQGSITYKIYYQQGNVPVVAEGTFSANKENKDKVFFPFSTECPPEFVIQAIEVVGKIDDNRWTDVLYANTFDLDTSRNVTQSIKENSELLDLTELSSPYEEIIGDFVYRTSYRACFEIFKTIMEIGEEDKGRLPAILLATMFSHRNTEQIRFNVRYVDLTEQAPIFWAPMDLQVMHIKR